MRSRWDNRLPGLKMHLFGHPVAELDGQPIVFETRKAFAILIYLSLSPQPVSREFLATLFWPEFSQTQALSNLRRNLSTLASSLKKEVLEIDRQAVYFRDMAILSIDIRDFQQKIKDIQKHQHDQFETCEKCLLTLEKAIQAYHGEFLEGFNLRDCPGFDDWQYQQRQELQQELHKAFDGYIKLCVIQNQPEKAILACRRLIAMDPLEEAAHRKMMGLYAAYNQRKMALRQYEECVHILEKELSQPPEPETTRLFNHIRDGNPVQLEEMLEMPSIVPAVKTVNPPAPPRQQRNSIPETILRTKLFIPPARKDAVNRPRLIDRINQGVQGALTLVSAPAGFGKTTLLASWSAQSSIPVGWVSLDADDNDPSRFWTYFITGLRAIQPDVGQAGLEMLKSPQLMPAKAILTTLLNEIGNIPRPFILILDDYQVITAQPIHEALTFLLEHIPPNLHLIIATRSDPLLPVARLRARNQLISLRDEDLRFKTEEIVEFTNRLMGIRLSEQEIDLLEERTEGWAVGLQMAALSIQGREDHGSFIQSFHGTHRFILDYLTDEVLNQLPQEIQRFLLQTSILERLCAPLCDFVITEKGIGSASVPSPSEKYQSILENLDRSNLFIVSLDNDRCWYRYHHLFADLLSSRLQQSQPGMVPILHGSASEWFEQNGLFNEAIHHALAARDYERAARLIEKIALFLIGKCESDTLISWFHAFPEDFFYDRPWLCIYNAWALILKGQVENIEALLNLAGQAAQAGLPAVNSQELACNIEGIRVYTSLLGGRTVQAVELALRVRERLPSCSPVTRCIIEYTMASAFIASNNPVEANRSFQNAANIALEFGNIYLSILALADLAGVYKLQGRLHKAELLYKEIHWLHTKSGAQPFFLPGILEADLGELLLEWNRLEEASNHIQNSITSNLEGGNSNLLALSYLYRVRLLLARKEISAAWEVFSKAEQTAHEFQLYPRTYQLLDSWRVRLWLARRDFAAVSHWLQQQKALPAGDEPALGMVEEIGIAAQARGLIALERYAEALFFLDRLAKAAEDGGRQGSLIEILVLRAIAYQAQHIPSAAYNSLEKALMLAEPEGYIRIFLDEGEAMRLLIVDCLLQFKKKSRKDHKDLDPRLISYAERLLAAFPSAGHIGMAQLSINNQISNILTNRELEILRLLAAGCSNQQIAETLFITNSTVKSHIHHIFNKIDVESRTQLIIRAKELNLV